MESSTSKGTLFENQVYDLVSKLVQQDEFMVPKKLSKVFKKKAYYSSKRLGNIVFDVTIETTLPNANHYSILTIIECKDLNRKVSIDDIEEFSSKIDQVGIHNAKGILISTNSFHESVLNFAISEGIGLIRINSKNEIQWINYRKNQATSVMFENQEELTNDDINFEPFIAVIKNKKLTNFADVFLELSVIDFFQDKEDFIYIPFVSHERLNEIVKRLQGYNVYDNNVLNFEKLTKFLEPKYNVTFLYNTVELDNYLGKIEFNPLIIKISYIARSDLNRWRFTLAHEIGHLILHSSLLKERIDKKVDDPNTLALKYSSTNKSSEKLEIQANMFASYLLLPENIVVKTMGDIFNKYRIHRRYLYLDNQPVNQNEVFKILYEVSSMLKVSVSTLKYRLIKLNLLIDKTDYKIGTIMRRNLRKK